ncbi:MAG: acetyl-CoA carboxylase biotin carboxyl carrier protein subunit [Desulfatirhabdiaceae bacterium]
MHRRIELLNTLHEVVVTGTGSKRFVRIGDDPARPAKLTESGTCGWSIQMGEAHTHVTMKAKGEMVYIRAFGRTFELRIVDPMEQASQKSAGVKNRARAPMPGVVVDVQVAEGEQVAKGQTMMTIESMKILTSIPAPRQGQIDKIHFKPGQLFEKGAVLVTLSPEAP